MRTCERSVCSFQNWYPKLRSFSIKSVFQPIPEDVLNYLRSDGVVVPREAVVSTVKPESDEEERYVGSIVWDRNGENDDEIEPPSFPEFSDFLLNVLKDFDGEMFIKLNWSAPTDASWIATNNCLKCTNLQDIYLLLKSSDKLAKDLSTDYKCKNDDKYFIVLKKWKEIHPSSEFRCFVLGGELLALTQRDTLEYYQYMSECKYDIVKDIKQFFYSVIKDNFPLTNYTFDVIRMQNSTVKIVDFGVLDNSTDCLLFSYNELKEIEYAEGISPEFRFIGEDIGMQPKLRDHFGMPSDLTDLPVGDRRYLMSLLQRKVESQRND